MLLFNYLFKNRGISRQVNLNDFRQKLSVSAQSAGTLEAFVIFLGDGKWDFLHQYIACIETQ